MHNRTVWITGVGTANPLGFDLKVCGGNLLNGRSGIRTITDFDLPDNLSHLAARLGPVPCPDCCNEGEFRKLAPVEQMFLWSAHQALVQAGIWEQRQTVRIGLVLALGAEWLFHWEDGFHRGTGRVGQPDQDRRSTLRLLQDTLGLHGPAATVGAACASGGHALAQARQWIRMGWADVCLAAAGDVFVTPFSISCFGNLRALSLRNDDPEGASRPFDQERDGFVMGEGGAVFVLESAEHARRRGASPLAEFAGFGATSDAHHMVIPCPDPAPAVKAMRLALADARVNRDEVDYVNAHATSTPAGDTAESKVLATVFGPYVRRIPVSSTKSMTGHLLSGAAAMNVLACIVALQEQALPPTINLDHPDPECDLCHIPHQARPQKANVVVSNSLGFGGSNTSIVLKKAA